MHRRHYTANAADAKRSLGHQHVSAIRPPQWAVSDIPGIDHISKNSLTSCTRKSMLSGLCEGSSPPPSTSATPISKLVAAETARTYPFRSLFSEFALWSEYF